MCLACKQLYLLKTQGDLYEELKYFQYMFGLPKFEQSSQWYLFLRNKILIQVTPDMKDAYRLLNNVVFCFGRPVKTSNWRIFLRN